MFWLAASGGGFPLLFFLKVSQLRTLGLSDGSSSVTGSIQFSHLGFETMAHVTCRQFF